jgi:hypothetical protein
MEIRKEMEINQRQNGELLALREGQQHIEQRLRYLELEISKFKGMIVIVFLLINLLFAPLFNLLLKSLFF